MLLHGPRHRKAEAVRRDQRQHSGGGQLLAAASRLQGALRWGLKGLLRG